MISLARALLTPSSILVLDEATAAVDVQTDALLQATLRTPAFQNRTIITIAHRINTILDSDRIVVLQQGQVAEFDTPRNLVDKKGLFYELVKEAGLLDAEGGIEGSLRRMKEEAQLVIARGVEARGVDERSVVDIPPSNGNRLG